MNPLRVHWSSLSVPTQSLASRVRTKLSLTTVVLVVILAVALAMRLNGLNWDDGFGFHPDERDIYMRSDCMYQVLANQPGFQNCGYVQGQPGTVPGLPSLGVFLDPERSPLNPHWFPLGSVLLYFLVYLRSILELFTDFSSMDMRYVGRAVSALADVGSVLLVFVLGRRIYGAKVGLLAAALTALAVVHVQNSHFYRPETFASLFTLASFWAMFRMMERKRLADSLLLGIFAGLAVAPKVSGIMVLCPLALAYGYRLWDSLRTTREQDSEVWLRIAAHGAAALAVGAVVFFLSAPYALLDFASFKGDLQTQNHMVQNAGVWPFTVQYVGTAPYLYHIQQTAVWGLGLPLGVVAWLAVPLTAATLLWTTGRFRADSIILTFVLVSLVVQESFEVRFQRYLFTLMPLMILLGARILWWPVDRFGGTAGDSSDRSAGSGRARRVNLFRKRRDETLKWAAVGIVVFVVAATAFYAVAFQRVYERPHPAVTASQWINANIAPGTSIVSDNHWDEFLPNLYEFDVWQYPVYEADTPSKAETLAGRLADSEYLVFYSNRPYSSVSRDPDRFPDSTRYYQLLFSGELGYRLEKSFATYPGLWGVEFRDDPIGAAGLPQPKAANEAGPGALSFNLGYADDNVVGYDHPLVLLFRNVEGRSFEELLDLLEAGQSMGGTAEPGGLMLSEANLAAQREGGTWSQVIQRESWTNRLPVLAWLLAVELVYLAALPLAFFIFRPLPDRGIILARILGLLLVSYIAWMSVSLGWVEFSRSPIILGFLVLSAASVLVMAMRGTEVMRFIKQRWRLLLGVETLFLLSFLAFVLVRAANPDLWHPWRGGEKPMELAYFSAVIKSSTMPPFDPWFSGGYLNYYYWGYFMPAALVRITGILPATAFNLAVPLFFALTVTGAFSLVYNLAEGVRGSRRRRRSGPPGKRGLSWRLGVTSPVAAGLLGALFVGVIGNLDGIIQVGQGLWRKFFQPGDGFPAFDFWRSSRAIPAQENVDPSPLVFWVPDKVPGAADITPHITEFPFFTFLFADLHAHMMAIPFYVLVLALGMNLAVGLRRESWRWILPASAALALALGSLWAVNSWDYPTFALLVLALVALGAYLRPGPDQHRARLAVSLAALVVVGSIVAFLPFHQTYETFNGGLEPTKWRTPLIRYLWIYGLFLFIAVTFVLFQLRGGLVRVYSSIRAGNLPDRLPDLSKANGRAIALGAGVVLAALMAVAGFWTSAVLLVFLLAVGWVGWKLIASNREDRAFTVMPLIWLAMGLGVSIGVDFVRVTGDIGRMNTLFKYYLEVWVLFGLAGAFLLWRLVDSGVLRRVASPVRWVWIVAVLALLGSSLIYTVLGTRARLADRFETASLTLDGTAYMNTATHVELREPFRLEPDLRAIEWLQDNVEGSPVVLEAHGDQYRWNGRISIYTGLPTVLGWPWHQIQQRMDYASQVGERARDVATIYNTTDLLLADELLQQYQIEYIVVGQLERIYYDGPGLDKFDTMEQLGQLRRVYDNRGGVLIFRILPS